MNFLIPFRQEEPTYLLHKVEVMLDILVLQTLDEVLTTHAKLGLSSKNILLQREDRQVRDNRKKM
jgi:hypothetical protein